MMKRYTLLLLVVLLLITSYTSSALDDEITTLDNETLNLSEFNGELLVLEAFSTTCSHCIDYHPTLVEINNEFNSQITLVSVSISSSDTIETLTEFKADYPSNWTVGLDEDRSLVEKFNIPGTPSTLFFDGDGELKGCFIGRQETNALRAELNAFIADPTGFEGPLEDGVCEGPSGFQQFLGSIYFPIVMGLVIYAGYLVIRYYFQNKS